MLYFSRLSGFARIIDCWWCLGKLLPSIPWQSPIKYYECSLGIQLFSRQSLSICKTLCVVHKVGVHEKTHTCVQWARCKIMTATDVYTYPASRHSLGPDSRHVCDWGKCPPATSLPLCRSLSRCFWTVCSKDSFRSLYFPTRVLFFNLVLFLFKI